jgi:hypothetical protein
MGSFGGWTLKYIREMILVGVPSVGLVTEIYRETILLGVPLVDIGYWKL